MARGRSFRPNGLKRRTSAIGSLRSTVTGDRFRQRGRSSEDRPLWRNRSPVTVLRKLPIALVRRFKPFGRNDLPRAIRDSCLEVTVSYLRPQWLRQSHQRALVTSRHEVRVIGKARGNERPRSRINRNGPSALFVGERFAADDFDFYPVKHRKPAKLSRHRLSETNRSASLLVMDDTAVFFIYPRPEVGNDPTPFRSRGRVEREHQENALTDEHGTHPTRDRAHLKFKKLRRLIEGDKVVRATAPLLNIVGVLQSGKL